MTVVNQRGVRRYGPLAPVAIAFTLAAFVLPSALTLPQTNPTQTLEYAPVPPTDDSDSPPQGNLGSLGLGTTATESGVGGSVNAVGGPPVAPVASGLGARPRTKHCVGTPPRQTDDPLAPPCVAYFTGDNGGATTRGVTAQEVRVLVYADGVVVGTTDRGQ